MRKREANFGILFRHWLKANPMPSAAFELKQTITNSLPFSAVKEHQIQALQAVEDTGLLWKIVDDSRGIKPFDYFYLRQARGFIVIKYPDFFCLIPISIFYEESKTSKRRSLTAERAKKLSPVVVLT